MIVEEYKKLIESNDIRNVISFLNEKVIDFADTIEDEDLFRVVFIQRCTEELILIARYFLKSRGNNLVVVVDKITKGKS